ncbi:hypothetical protein [Cyanobium sp. NIES-981]|uniref:hypothetical protein n=1 Tax=Cyanobium sp. NIES-981 TaxID=1851505 RepID=UPI0007DD045F|nr:hypothetical protein [Cyanobium sp. NIES-981]SBO42775.1 putative Gram-negative pili assembly chaperone [Cyanobium sp. NIES-981]
MTSLCSDSLVGSLCREADRLRQRCRSLSLALERCMDPPLRARLAAEVAQLQGRRGELERLAQGWRRRGGLDPLALAFLLEICSRSFDRAMGEAL